MNGLEWGGSTASLGLLNHMPILQNNIETLQSHLLFHRQKVQQYFLFLCALALLSFGTATAFKLISVSATQSLATALSKASRTALLLKDKGSNQQPVAIEVSNLSDLDEKSTENVEFRSEYVYVVSVALLILAILGLIRHHLRRVSIAEDRLFHIEKIHSILSADKPFDPTLISAILGNINHDGDMNSFEPSLLPSQEILERSINALSDISKIVTKRIK